MNNFKKGGFKPKSGGFSRPKFGGAGRGGRDGGRDRSDRPRGPMELYPAVCAECKKNCEVPFRPTGDKPVYCLDCFRSQPQVPGRNSNGRDSFGGDFRREAPREREYSPAPVRMQNDPALESIKLQLNALEFKVSRILEIVGQKPEVHPATGGAHPATGGAKAGKAPVRKVAKKAKK